MTLCKRLYQARLLVKQLFLLIAISACQTGLDAQAEVGARRLPPLQAVDSVAQRQWVDSLMSTLSLRERIGQLFMVAAYSNKDEQHVAQLQRLVEQGIGGVIFFQGGPVRQARITNRLQAKARVPLMVAMDAEWGLGMRLDSTVSYPRQMVMGAHADTATVYMAAADIAQQMRRLGVHVNFAPVVDVNCNSKNPVINTRSFGDNPQRVAQMASAFIAGLQDNGVMAVAKHFPGHGDTHVDSHLDLPLIEHTAQRLDSVELVPFASTIKNGVQGVMVAHLNVPALEPQPVPSTLSHRIVDSLLFQKMGFEGLVFTDAMNMQGLTKYFGALEANVRALRAGNDVLEFVSEVNKTVAHIEKLVNDGELPDSLINAKCRKVLMAKYKLGLANYKPIEINGLTADLNRSISQAIRQQVIAKGLVLLNNSRNVVPMRGLDTLRIAYLEVGGRKGKMFANRLEYYAPITRYSINPGQSAAEFDAMFDRLDRHNLVIVGLHGLSNSAKKAYGITPTLSNFLFDLSQRKNVVLSVFGSPYALEHLQYPSAFGAILIAFDNSSDSQDIAAQLLMGGRAASGRLPVATAGYEQGTGCVTQQTRIAYAKPEEIGVGAARLADVDSLALMAIDTGATPGLQVLAAKDGAVFYNKCFGGPTYTSTMPIDDMTLYDAASVTKVMATLPVIMHMYDQGRLPLTAPLGDYTNLSETPDKANIVLRDLLLHRAGLTAWIPFYLSTLSTLTGADLYSNAQSDDYPFMLSKNRYMNKHVSPDPQYYSNTWSMGYPTRVADNLYVKEGIIDTIRRRMDTSTVRNAGGYKYSDLSFMYLQRVAENMLQHPIDELADSLFYRRLGMTHTTFRPLQRFDRLQIAPTEHDLTFRQQLLWGDVHDQGAALMGGVSGHAGLFSNANDLAKMLQMWLWGGCYGGERLLADTTVALFTTQPADSGQSRRALGFDRPNFGGTSTPCGTLASPKSYGHLGFTGTIVWADPVVGLVYVLMSNRVHPDASNNLLQQLHLRTQIHDALYKAIGVVPPAIAVPDEVAL